MDRVVVFRFHRDPEVCRSRLDLLRRLNPEVPVYGLGERIGLAEEFEDLHVIEDRDPDWQWRHGDLALARWFREVGRDLAFDRLHLVEWDLLLCAPLADLYGHVPAEGVGLSGIRPMAQALHQGWAWVTDGEYDHADDYRRVREHVRRELGHDREAPSCIFPGLCLPREFLAEYADLDPPELCNDEVRIPLYARALGYELYDTGFHWWTDAGRRYFNGRGEEIDRDRIDSELADPRGRRAFHPVRAAIDPDELPGVA